jgi:hypothetical protein
MSKLTELRRDLRERRNLDKYAERVLGANGWALLKGYGRVTSGPHSGCYVSALDLSAATAIVQELAEGNEASIHLMHRHVSGSVESSRLLLSGGRLIMRFRERDEIV